MQYLKQTLVAKENESAGDATKHERASCMYDGARVGQELDEITRWRQQRYAEVSEG